ncbi:MAG TPA: amidase [Burkholderiales bacterium]|nr:amidase [Burkholderiales bacterium]
MKPLHELGAAELAPLLARRELSAEQLARACLERIAAREPVVRAFAHLDPERALDAARALDRAAPRGPLHGLPLGVKDIIDTFDYPTEHGSAIYAGNRPASDAACVALARAAGALVIGKTVTTEFATFAPGPTTNPRNAAHTPGGSSSGSAAAVADRMLPLAFGTQTGGSIVRPAAYCGVVGYKPSFDLLPRAGVKAISESLDTIGVFARSVEDAALFAAALSAREALRIPRGLRAPTLGLCLTPQWPAAQPETHKLFDDVAGHLSRSGARVVRLALPPEFEALAALHGTVWDYEIARCLADEYSRHRDRIGEALRAKLERGRSARADAYDAAQRAVRACRARLADALDDCDALVAPAAPGEAPAGLSSTGDSVFNRMWTLLHAPAVCVPVRTGPLGLPLGVQVVGRIGDDARTLACAHWVQLSEARRF